MSRPDLDSIYRAPDAEIIPPPRSTEETTFFWRSERLRVHFNLILAAEVGILLSLKGSLYFSGYRGIG
jgi:hypothetical protein